MPADKSPSPEKQTEGPPMPAQEPSIEELLDEYADKLTDLISANPQAIATTKADANATRTAIEDRWRELESERLSLSISCTTLRHQSDRYDSELSRLREQVRELEDQNDSLRTECSGWQDLTESAETELSKLRGADPGMGNKR